MLKMSKPGLFRSTHAQQALSLKQARQVLNALQWLIPVKNAPLEATVKELTILRQLACPAISVLKARSFRLSSLVLLVQSIDKVDHRIVIRAYPAALETSVLPELVSIDLAHRVTHVTVCSIITTIVPVRPDTSQQREVNAPFALPITSVRQELSIQSNALLELKADREMFLLEVSLISVSHVMKANSVPAMGSLVLQNMHRRLALVITQSKALSSSINLLVHQATMMPISDLNIGIKTIANPVNQARLAILAQVPELEA